MTNIVSTLNEGVVSFTYKKADGSTRQARGTTNADLIPADQRAVNPRNTETSEQVDYYDLDKNGWRRFTRSALVESSVSQEANQA